LLARNEEMEDHYVFFMGGRCTKTRTYMKTSNSKDNIFGKLDGLQLFSRCSFENLGCDTTIVAHDSELNGLKT
jgi:hypothetical protein